MYCVIVWWSDRSGIVIVLGPWARATDAELTVEVMAPFSDGKIFEVRAMAPVIVPATVAP